MQTCIIWLRAGPVRNTRPAPLPVGSRSFEACRHKFKSKIRRDRVPHAETVHLCCRLGYRKKNRSDPAGSRWRAGSKATSPPPFQNIASLSNFGPTLKQISVAPSPTARMLLRALVIAGLISVVSCAALYDKDPNVEQLNALNFHTVRFRESGFSVGNIIGSR